jgi:hypothetical protein
MDAWVAKHGKGGIAIVQYKRRFWNEGLGAFQYEANWTQYTLRQFVEIGNITFKLDTPLLNNIKTSSLILKFKNSDYQMLDTNSTSGILAPDAASQAVQLLSPLRGYTLKLMQFQVLFGYQLASGATETTELFTGVCIDDNFQIESGYAEITVSGNEYLLQSSDAQLTSFLEPLAGGVVTVNTNDRIDFTVNGGGALSAQVAAGTYTSITALLAAVMTAMNTADAGGGWTASAPTNAPYVTLTRGSGVAVIKWNTGTNTATNIHALLGFINTADTASAISATGTVAIPGQPTTGSVKTWATSVTSPAFSVTLPAPYTSTTVSGTGTGVSAPNLIVYDSGRTVAGGYPNGPVLQQGTDYSITSDSQAGVALVIGLNASPLGTITWVGREWYALPTFDMLVTLLSYNAGFTSSQLNISPVVFPGTGGGGVVTLIGQFSGSSYATAWTAIWEGAGDNPTLNSPASGVLGVQMSGGGGGSVYPNGASTPSTPAYGVWTFPMSGFSSGNAIMCVSFMSSSNVFPGASNGYQLGGNGYYLQFTFISGNFGLTLNRMDSGVATTLANVAAAPAGVIGGWAAQHNWTVTRGTNGLIQVYCDGLFIMSATDNTYTTSTYFVVWSNANGIPFISTLGINIGTITNTLALVTTLADFQGLKAYDAIQELAKLANYEWGFDSTGKMYFRSKTPANPLPILQPNGNPIPFDQSDGISKILEFRSGMADVVNDAQVTTPGFYREYNSSTAPESQPTSQQEHLTQILSEDYSDFQLAFDPIIAASRSQEIHDNNYRKRATARIASKIMPFAELSDVLSFSFYNRPIMVSNIFGDPLQKWGKSAFGKPRNVLARNLPGKTISIIMDPNHCTGEYQLQEVLS